MHKSTLYRPDIDGLRAIAVMAVILFHFKIDGFNGGLTGVDVFFVISGFLLTRIIIKEVKAGTFSLLTFWERRMRRIIPALVVVMSVTAIFSYFRLLMPSDLMEFGKTLMAQSVFVSNWWFMSTIDYFSASVETMPLLHTWTLAVEEQFYILFPMFCLFTYPYVKKSFGLVIVGAALLSFFYSVFLLNGSPTESFAIPLLPNIWGVATNSSAGFYFIVPRFWEFLVGGIIAIYSFQIRNQKVAEAIAFIGLGTIFAGIFFLREGAVFSSVFTLLPVLGTAAVIVANTRHQTKVGKALSFRVIVWVGLLSYSLYLWHWPLLVFSRYQLYQDEHLTIPYSLFLVVVIFLLSFLTYRYVETPFRKKQYLAEPNKMYIFTCITLAILFCSGLLVTLERGFPSRVSSNAQLLVSAVEDTNLRTEECFTRSKAKTGSGNNEPCLLGIQNSSQVDFVLWGDSHANATMPAFDEYGLTTNQTGIFFGKASCPPLISTLPITADQACLQETENAISYIKDTIPKEVFMVAEWEEGYTFVEKNYGPFLSQMLSDTISQLPEETQFTILLRIPTLKGFTHRDLFLRVELESIEPKITVQRDEFELIYLSINNQIIKGLSTHKNTQIIDPLDTMCIDTSCYTGTTDGLYYSDSSHLSTYGARKIILPLLLSHAVDSSTPAE